MKLNRSEIKQIEHKIEIKKNPQAPPPPHHSGKGTPARINTAAEKTFFNSKFSK